MTYSFNLMEQPWIPCIHPNGYIQEYGIEEVLYQAHNLRSIVADSPLETAAIHRLLLAVLHSALRGPTSIIQWYQLWQTGSWNAPWLREYIQKWRIRFDLFDPNRPFFQAVDERVKEKSIISLVVDMASGNNAVLFDHHTEEAGVELSSAKAARTLITAQAFSLAGLSGLEQKFTDSPWSRGIIFLIEGRNLFETLMLNLLLISSEKPLPNVHNDCPAWEMDDPFKPERQLPRGYLDYLTWQNRRVFLKPEGIPEKPTIKLMTVAPGLRLDSTVLDPMKHYRKDEERGYMVLRFSEERALWRDHAALLAFNSQNFHPPQNLRWVAQLADEEYIKRPDSLRFMAFGMANDQAKVEFLRHEHMAIPQAYFENDRLIEELATALEFAEQTNRAIRESINWLAMIVISPNAAGKKWKELSKNAKEEAYKLSSHWGAERLYWGVLEPEYLLFLNELPLRPEKALNSWKQTLQNTAWQTLEDAAGLAGESPSALRAAVYARRNLGWNLKSIFNSTIKEAIE